MSVLKVRVFIELGESFLMGCKRENPTTVTRYLWALHKFLIFSTHKGVAKNHPEKGPNKDNHELSK